MADFVHSYDVHGLPLRVEAETEILSRGAESVLSPYRVSPRREDAFFVRICQGPGGDGQDAEGMTCRWRGKLPDGIELVSFTGGGRQRFDLLGLASVCFDPAGRIASIVLAEGAEWCLARGCVVPLLCQMLAVSGQHVLHAACLAAGDPARGILLAGESGRGKTTTALALARSGMALLGDDCCFACTGEADGLEVWALLLDCKVHPRTLGMMPWLNDLPHRPCPTSEEFYVDAREALGAGRPMRVPPGAVLLLEPPNDAGHRLETVERFDALARLASENVRAPDASAYASASAAFGTIARLVSRCEVRRLSVGPDVASLGEFLLRELGW